MPEKGVGALVVLDGQHLALLHDRALADVLAADVQCGLDASLDVLFRLPVGFGLAKDPLLGEQAGKQLVGADDAKSLFFLEVPDQRRHQAIVAE